MSPFKICYLIFLAALLYAFMHAVGVAAGLAPLDAVGARLQQR